MQESELKPGDVIFFENNYKGENPYDYVDHVAIYDGLNAEGQPTVIHCISNEQGYYYFLRSSGLCRSTLRSLKDLVQREEGYPDVNYDVTYKVFRCENELIVHKALEILRNQVQYRIPYDEQRLQDKLAKEDAGMEPDEFKDAAKAEYLISGKYRSMKYAAREPRMLTRTRNDGIGRGLTCAMTIILGYQIAELKLGDKVHAQRAGEWASDKYASSTTLLGHYPQAYVNYCQELRTRQYHPSSEPRLKLSYQFWKDDQCSPEDYTHTTFAVDAKVIGAAGMYAYMLENPVWALQGVLHAEERHYSVEARARNRSGVLENSINAVVMVRDATTQTAVQRSTRPSANPLAQELESECLELDDFGDDWEDRSLRTGKW